MTRERRMRHINKETERTRSQSVNSPSAVCILACMIMLGSVLPGCDSERGKDGIERPKITGVTITAVTPVQIDDMYETSGTIRSDRTSIISSRAMGAVTSLMVREGEQVKTGQLLLTIDDRDARERMNAAAMGMESARNNRDLNEITRKRYRVLFEQKSISTQEMDQIEAKRNMANADFERAKAMADEAKTLLAFTRVVAPAEGVVTKKQTDVGSMASPGMPLLVIEALGSAYAEASIDEGLSGKIRAGMPVEVTIDALGRRLHGSIRDVLPDISPNSRSFIVKIGLPDKELKSGLYVKVKIPVGKKEVLLVPFGAIVRKGQLTGVYVVDAKGVITYRLIREGMKTAQGIDVLSGLNPNERVITSGVEKAVDGGVIHEGNRQ
jgi:RND family efflux transporter MFP subunit